MNKTAFQISIDAEQFLKQLTPEQQLILSKKLWAIRIERISQKMRDAAKKSKITPKDIEQMCKEARKKVYEKYCH